MDNEFPPLPRPSLAEGVEQEASARQAPPSAPDTNIIEISPDGDVLLDCTLTPGHSKSAAPGKYLVRISSATLKRSSDYFKVLLDPGKFHEGQVVVDTLAQLEAEYGSHSLALQNARVDQLPRLTIELPPISSKVARADALKTYFGVLCLFGKRDTSSNADGLLSKLADGSIPLLASLAVLSDRFASHQALNHALRWADGHLEKDPSAVWKIMNRLRFFQNGDEVRLREAIYLSLFLQNEEAVGYLTHLLILRGSINWLPDSDHGDAGLEKPLWWHLPDGIEEELQLRHELILDTISEVQTHFLHAYGAINPFQLLKSPSSTSPQLQCRRAIGNSRACDSFHLGEMIQFFTSRSKTLLLESTLLTSDLDFDEEDIDTNSTLYNDSTHPANPQNNLPNNLKPSPPINIRAVIASLRECPEYQIDNNHLGCGIRRRLIPILDCIEGIMGLPGATGICLKHCDFTSGGDSWNNKTFRDNIIVAVKVSGSLNVDYTRIDAIHEASDGKKASIRWSAASIFCDCMMKGRMSRALFTAKSREWEGSSNTY